ncbi:MAG: alcohol dehydrogenase catalytic domain-containing protein [Planctomycetota bacterium]
MLSLRRTDSRVVLDSKSPVPVPVVGEALVRITRVALGSPDAVTTGEQSPFQGTLGQEGVGVVEHLWAGATGEESRKWERKRVAISSVLSCGACEVCRGGMGWHCVMGTAMGRMGRDGVLAQFAAVPLRNLTEIPSGLDDDRAAFAGVVGSVVQMTHAVRVERRTFVTVLGDGVTGLIAGQLLAKSNASVRLLGRHESRFLLCERWGIKHRHERDAGRRGDQDVVVDCTGMPGGLEMACKLVRPRGVIVVKGPPSRGVRQSRMVCLDAAASHEVTVIFSAASNPREGLGVLEARGVDVLALITRRGKLSDGAALLDWAGSREHLAVLVEPEAARGLAA